MVLTKREKYIAIGAAGALGLIILQTAVIGPYVAQRSQLTTDISAVKQELNDGEALVTRQVALNKVWLEMQKGGLKAEPSQAESQAQQAVLDWATSANVTLDAFKREQPTEEGKFQVISFSVQAHGTTPGFAQLLWDLETAKIPLRINEIRFQSLKEATDNLQVSALSISTLCAKPEALEGSHDATRVASISER